MVSDRQASPQGQVVLPLGTRAVTGANWCWGVVHVSLVSFVVLESKKFGLHVGGRGGRDERNCPSWPTLVEHKQPC